MKNKIITISGEPVSGKGTTVKALIEKLKEKGYTDEQIHLLTTGHEFRKYFNSIIDLIVNLDNKDQFNELLKRDELRELLGDKEYRKAITKTIIQLKNEGTDLSKFTIEQANNSKTFEAIRNVIDKLLDEGNKKLGEDISKGEYPNDIWIIDSRLAFYNIPHSFAIRLTTNPDIAAQRLFKDKSRGKEDNEYKSIEEAKIAREHRRIGERKRYIDTYGVDIEDESNYNLIIDTSYSSIQDITDVILECEQYYEEDKPFTQKWASPKIFLPLQTEMDTLRPAPFAGDNFDEMVKSIQENGYYPDSNIEVINVDGYNYIIEGHHRNFAAAYAGKTLIPYEIIAKDDEVLSQYGNNTARDRAESLQIKYLYGHESFIQKQDPDFSYSNMFPKLMESLKEIEGR